MGVACSCVGHEMSDVGELRDEKYGVNGYAMASVGR